MGAQEQLPEAPYDFVIAARPVYDKTIRSQRKMGFFGVLPMFLLVVFQIQSNLVWQSPEKPSDFWRTHTFVPALLVSVGAAILGGVYVWFAARTEVLQLTHDSLTYRANVTASWRLARYPRSPQARRTKALATSLSVAVVLVGGILLGALMLSSHFHEHAVLMFLGLFPLVSWLAVRRCVEYLTITRWPRFASAAFNDPVVAQQLGSAQYRAEKLQATAEKQLSTPTASQ